MKAATRPKRRTPRIALVLQGGGALGAYQAGVYQALHEHEVIPDWVVGTSIGAINGAIIAGNRPEDRVMRLKEFWQGVARDDVLDMSQVPDPGRQANTLFATTDAAIRGVPGFFSPRLFSLFNAGFPVDPEKASFYDTGELSDTLTRLVDFQRIGMPGAMRLTVSAMRVTNGELVNFDSALQPINVAHVMASGALPPGFPPVRIDGELYWDGGLYSNTPLEIVLEDEPRADTICFMVDLWHAEGQEPRSYCEVQTREKDVTFASRSARHIDAYRRLHDLRHAVRILYDQLPAASRNSAAVREAAAMGCSTTMHLVRLPYSGQDWRMPSKDINFSRGSIEWRWEQGYRDATRALARAAWLEPQPANIGVVVHELPPELVAET